MSPTDNNDDYGLEDGAVAVVTDPGTLATLQRSEIETMMVFAKKYPRSIRRFRDEALSMVTINEQVASECNYALLRDGKVIEGPSARFAEVIASAWGNCRSGTRVVSDVGEFITSQGVFFDLERNVSLTAEVQRRIVNKHGRRYSADMIGVTGNAASSIALRNAVLKGIPKAFWNDLYVAARQCAMGDFKTLANRRADAVKAFVAFGVTEAMILTKLGLVGIEDMGLEKLLLLRGMLTAIRDGDTTPEQAFAPDDAAAAATTGAATAPKSKSEQGRAPATPPATPPASAPASAPASDEAGVTVATTTTAPAPYADAGAAENQGQMWAPGGAHVSQARIDEDKRTAQGRPPADPDPFTPERRQEAGLRDMPGEFDKGPSLFEGDPRGDIPDEQVSVKDLKSSTHPAAQANADSWATGTKAGVFMATPAEIKSLMVRAQARRIDLAELLGSLPDPTGVKIVYGDGKQVGIEGLTKEGYKFLRDQLA